MEVEEPIISAHIALAHGKSANFLLNPVQTSRCHRAEVGTVQKTTTTTPTTTTTTTTTRATINSSAAMGKALAHPKISHNTLHTFSSFSSGVNASHESFDCTLEYHVPTYPAIPPLRSENAANSTHRAGGISASPSMRLPRSSAMHLTTVVEHKPPVHAPARVTAKRSVETLEIFEIDDVAEKKEAVTGFLNVPTQDRGSRTSTMSSVVSAKSHQGPGAIYIRPSAQLQNMQSISDRDRRLQEAAKFYSSALSLANSRGICTPTGTPESISNVPLSTSVYQAHAKLNRSLSSASDFASRRGIQNWAKSSEWVEPCQTTEGPTEWIEDFLTRKEQADRAEEEQIRTEKKEKITIMRGNSINKFRRRLSRRRTTGEKRSIEPWRGKLDNVDMPEWARTFSWDVRAHDDGFGQDDPSNRTSNRVSPDRTPSPPPPAPPSSEVAKPSRRSPPAPSRFPTSQNPFVPCTPTNPKRRHKHDSPQLSPRTSNHPLQSRSSSKTGSLPKLKSRSVSLIGTDVKKSFSTTVVPILAEGKNSISELVGKLERLGQGLRLGVVGRKLRWKRKAKGGKWKRELERKKLEEDEEDSDMGKRE